MGMKLLHFKADLRIEGIRSENIFSELTTSWYDYCLAKELYSKGAYCWSIEIAYYSALHALRAIMHTSIRLTEYFMNNRFKIPPRFRSHSAFVKLLIKCDSLTERDEEELIIIDVMELLGLGTQFLKTLGKILEAMKKAREIHVYQHLIVAHQIRVIPMEPISSLMIKAAFKIIVECTNAIVYNFLIKMTDKVLKYCYSMHFIDEIKQFKKLLVLEHIEPAKELIDYMNQVNNEVNTRIRELLAKLSVKEELNTIYQTFNSLHKPTTHFSIVLREIIGNITHELNRSLN